MQNEINRNREEKKERHISFTSTHTPCISIAVEREKSGEEETGERGGF